MESDHKLILSKVTEETTEFVSVEGDSTIILKESLTDEEIVTLNWNSDKTKL